MLATPSTLPLPPGPVLKPPSEDSDASGEDELEQSFQSFKSEEMTSSSSAAEGMKNQDVTEYLREQARPPPAVARMRSRSSRHACALPQDRFMPIAIIAKIMARELSHLGFAKISHDAKTLMQEAATEFICFIMSEANDQALQAKRKSVTGQDIINACDQMDMRELVQPMTNALPHLQPPKRVRGKATEQDPSQSSRRRRCRVSDDEVEQIRLARLAAAHGEIKVNPPILGYAAPATLMPPVPTTTHPFVDDVIA